MARKLKVEPADAQIAYNATFGVNGISDDLVLNQKSLQNVADGVVEVGTLPAAPALSSIMDLSFVRDMRNAK